MFAAAASNIHQMGESDLRPKGPNPDISLVEVGSLVPERVDIGI